MKRKFVRNPVEIMSITKNVFNASLLKFSPYRSDSVDLKCGETRLLLKTTRDEMSRKVYHCDLFGCGLQFVTMEIDPFRDDDKYQVRVLKSCFH